jgi:hypothetical protein
MMTGVGSAGLHLRSIVGSLLHAELHLFQDLIRIRGDSGNYGNGGSHLRRVADNRLQVSTSFV